MFDEKVSKDKKTKESRGKTKDVSLKLLQDGFSIDEIADNLDEKQQEEFPQVDHMTLRVFAYKINRTLQSLPREKFQPFHDIYILQLVFL